MLCFVGRVGMVFYGALPPSPTLASASDGCVVVYTAAGGGRGVGGLNDNLPQRGKEKVLAVFSLL